MGRRSRQVVSIGAALGAFASLITVASGAGAAPTGNSLVAETVLEVQVAGVKGIPSDAAAVALNVTLVDSAGGGYATAFPCGEPRPNASNVNFATADTVPNAVIVRPGTGGKVCIVASANADLIVDASGWFAKGTNATWLTSPTRVLSTRDGIGTAKAKVAAGGVLQLPFPALPAGARSAVLNLTVTNTDGAGYLSAYPCGSAPPNASNLNFVAGDTVANLAIVKPGTGGAVCLFASAATDVIADLTGWLAAGYNPLDQPLRVLSTRDGIGGAKSPVAKAATRSLTLTPPADAVAAVLNVTVTNTGGAGYLTVHPCGGSAPDSSTLNFRAADTVANLAIVSLPADKSVCFTAGEAATDVIADLSGWLTAASGYGSLPSPARLLDTRRCQFAISAEDVSPAPGGVVTAAYDIVVRDLTSGASRAIAKSIVARPGFSSTWYGRPYLARDCYAYTTVHHESSSSGLVNDRIDSELIRLDLRTGEETFIADVEPYYSPTVIAESEEYLILSVNYQYDGGQVWGIDRETGAYQGLPYIGYSETRSSLNIGPGARFAYFLNFDYETPRTTDLVELDLTNGARRTVVEGVEGRAVLRGVSHAGTSILVESSRKVSRIDLATGASTALPGSNPISVGWTPDDRPAMVLTADPTKVVAVNPDGTTATLFSSVGGGAIAWFAY